MPDVLHPVDGPDEDPTDEQGLADGSFAVATTADDAIEAELIRNACEDAGIPAIVRAPRSSMVGKIDSPTDSHEVMVRVSDLARAQALIAPLKASLEGDQAESERAAVEEEAAGEAAALKP